MTSFQKIKDLGMIKINVLKTSARRTKTTGRDRERRQRGIAAPADLAVMYHTVPKDKELRCDPMTKTLRKTICLSD